MRSQVSSFPFFLLKMKILKKKESKEGRDGGDVRPFFVFF